MTAETPLIAAILPTAAELEELFLQKYGRAETTGWGPRLRHGFGYYLPSDIYEAVMQKLVVDGCRWLDVGGGHQLFPGNRELARVLSERCATVVGVDPSDNILKNTFVRESSQCRIEDYHSELPFDLASLRMVAEHIEDPSGAVQSIHRLLRPGGLVVVLTVNEWAPVAIATRLTPFRLHHPVKEILWGGDKEDTFPVQYKMNRRRSLSGSFRQHGFRELCFAYVDDCSIFGRFRVLNCLELQVRRVFRAVAGWYPENCLLGVYQRVDSAIEPERRGVAQV
jgi:SAM-dependent methyltransferase